MKRRAMLGMTASLLATTAWGNAPERSLRPVARQIGVGVSPVARKTAADIIAETDIGGTVGFMIADVKTGEVLEAVNADAQLPPASVTKAITALYALEAMGPAHRYQTNIVATAPIVDGILSGDLILAGGGDPTLDTDDLAQLAAQLKDAGLTEVRGDFFVWGGALPAVEEIDPAQLDHLGYNPSISGLNLNFNRVHFEWKQNGAGYDVTMDARSENYRADVTIAKMDVVDRGAPVFAYLRAGDVDQWSVARGALRRDGSRWLPVRVPALYAGEVFATFARSHGIALKPAKRAAAAPVGTVIATHDSPPLTILMQDMLKYSTNLTAEVAGITATQARVGGRRGMRTSALGMTRWLDERGVAGSFVDHSGLGDASRISASAMVKLLLDRNAAGQLRPLMKAVRLVDENRKAIPETGAEVRAKTGTLNFVTTLSGYLRTPDGRDLAFAIFGADLEAREAGKRRGDETPAGSAVYNNRVKWLQQRLLQRWAVLGDLT